MSPQFVTIYQIAAEQYRSLSVIQSGARIIAIILVLSGALVLSRILNKRVDMSRVKIVGGTCFGIGILVIGAIVVLHKFRTKDALNAFISGQYSTVEGPVEQFDPMPFEGRRLECFSVQETRFCYSDYVVTPGFRNTASHGGPIRSGLIVRIAYKRIGSNNVILRLQVAK